MAVMGYRFQYWHAKSSYQPSDYPSLAQIVLKNRSFTAIDRLNYGDYGLEAAFELIVKAIKGGKRIALYADYDVDGTMSCVSWIWFLEAIGYKNFIYYIPDRFKEGYGVNLAAVQYLAKELHADVIITMDTGITANVEAQWCRRHGVEFICTDHHLVQPEKMPDCTILNPKLHPDPMYQQLCGCGITFVLLRKLGQIFNPSPEVWTDILALTGMATICDIVPLNGVNHRLAQHGVSALFKSQRPVLRELLKAAKLEGNEIDERDIGFRLGPRINAVGRLEHAEKVISAFIKNEPAPLIEHMGICNERRKIIQSQIVKEAREQAKNYPNDSILFLGGNWHQGVVGISASKIAEEFWRPVWLFQRASEGDSISKGSARSIPGFDVTHAMGSVKELFVKYGGHTAAGGFSFLQKNENWLRAGLLRYGDEQRLQKPQLWESSIHFDCHLPLALTRLELTDHLSSLRPFGHGFEEPLFCIEVPVRRVNFLKDKHSGEPKHTSVEIPSPLGGSQKIMFFNEVHECFESARSARFLVTASKNFWNNRVSLSLIGQDFEI